MSVSIHEIRRARAHLLNAARDLTDFRTAEGARPAYEKAVEAWEDVLRRLDAEIARVQEIAAQERDEAKG